MGIDNTKNAGEMVIAVDNYFASDDVTRRVEEAVECLLKEDDYYTKAMENLRSAIALLEYAEHVNQALDS